MEIVRNFINIAGLSDETELPDNVNGQIVQYAEVDTIFIPDNQPDVKSIYQIMIKVEINNSRRIKTPTGYTIILDGIKKLKIIYTQSDDSSKANFLDLELPYNTYVELPEHIKLNGISVYILDAYFNLLDKRKIYSHILYFVNVAAVSTKSGNATSNSEDITKSLEIAVAEKPLLRENMQSNKTLECSLNKTAVEINSDEISIDLDAEYL